MCKGGHSSKDMGKVIATGENCRNRGQSHMNKPEHNDLQWFCNWLDIPVGYGARIWRGELGCIAQHSTIRWHTIISVIIISHLGVTIYAPEMHFVHGNDQMWRAFFTQCAMVGVRQVFHDAFDTCFGQSKEISCVEQCLQVGDLNGCLVHDGIAWVSGCRL